MRTRAAQSAGRGVERLGLAQARTFRALAWVAAAVMASACGDPLVGGDYRGDPLLRVEGNIVLQSDVAAQDIGALGRLQVALFWLASLQPGSGTVAFRAEAGGVAQGLASPARYAFDLYHPPPDAVMVTFPDTTQQVGLALVLLFDDVNGDGQRQDEEPFVGGTRGRALLYTPQRLESPLLDGPLDAGFHLLAEARAATPDGALEGPPLCLTDASAAAFVRLTTTDQVDLDLDFLDNPWLRVPDVNCDGSAAEWCDGVRPFLDLDALPTPEDLITRICATPPDARDEILTAYSVCRSQLQEEDPCLPDFSRCDDPAAQVGPPWPPDHPVIDYYLCRHPQLERAGCRDLLSLSVPDHVLHDPMGAALEACSMAPQDPAHFDDFARAYSLCVVDPCFNATLAQSCAALSPDAPIPPHEALEQYINCTQQDPANQPQPLIGPR